MKINAHFDGKVFIPDEPVSFEAGEAVTLDVLKAYSGLPPTNQTPNGHTTGQGLSGTELANWILANPEPIWPDVGDSADFAAQLRKKSNTPRYRIDPD